MVHFNISAVVYKQTNCKFSLFRGNLTPCDVHHTEGMFSQV